MKKKKSPELRIQDQRSSSGTGFPGFLGPGLILKSGTGTGIQIQNLRDLGLGPGLKFEKSGTQDLERDASKNPKPETGLIIFSSGAV